MSFRVYIHDNPSNISVKRDITSKILKGGTIPLRPSIIRRNEIAQLISASEGIPMGFLAMWCDSTVQPTFLSRLIVDTTNQMSTFIGGTILASPDSPEEILEAQDDIISRQSGTVVKAHDSLIHWVIDSRIKEIHVANVRDLINFIMRKSEGDYTRFRNLYYSRLYPWAPILNEVHPSQIIEGTTGVFEESQNTEITSDSVVMDILERFRVLSSIVIDEDDSTGFINFVKLRLIPSVKIPFSESEQGSYMGLRLPYKLEPTGDRVLDMNLIKLFEDSKLGTGANQIHAIIFNDPLQPHNGRVRIATSEIRDGSVRQACLDEKLIRSFRSQEIQKTTEDDSKITDYLMTKILPGTVDNHKPYIRIVFSMKELPRGLAVFPDELLSELILYKDGQIQAYIVDVNLLDTLVFYIDLISKFIDIPKTIGYRPIIQEIKSQFDTPVIFKSNQTIKSSRKILSDALIIDSTISRETSRDDIYDDLFRMQYLRVNLPKDIVLSDVITAESIRKRISVLLLANFDNTQITDELAALRVRPGEILTAIGMLPDGKRPEDFEVMTQAHRIMYNNALDAYRHMIEEEQENRELSRIREEEGVENIVPDIQFRNNRDGSMTIFVFGCPNVEVLQNIKGFVETRLKIIQTRPRSQSQITPIQDIQVREPSLELAPALAPVPSPLPKVKTPSIQLPEVLEDLLIGEAEPEPEPEPEPVAKKKTPSPKPAADDLELDLDLDIGEAPVPAPAPVPVPAPAPAPAPAPVKVPTPASLERKDPSVELELGDDSPTPAPAPAPAPRPVPAPAPVPTAVQSSEEEVGLELELESEEEPKVPSPIAVPRPAPVSTQSEEGLDLDLDLGNGRRTRHDQKGSGRVIGPETLYNRSYTMNRLTGEPLTESDKKAKRTRYAETSAFQSIYESGIFKEGGYARSCPAGRQPIVITKEQLAKFIEERPGSFGYTRAIIGKDGGEPSPSIDVSNPDELRKAYRELTTETDMKRFAIPYKGQYYICPKYWSMSENMPLYPLEVKGHEADYIFDTRVKANDHAAANRGKDVFLSYYFQTNPEDQKYNPQIISFPGYLQKDKNLRPCCFQVPSSAALKIKPGDTQAEIESKFVKHSRSFQQNESEPLAPGRIELPAAAAAAAAAPTSVAAVAAGAAAAAAGPVYGAEDEFIDREEPTIQKPIKEKYIQFDSDDKWDSNKAMYLLADNEVLELMNLTGFSTRCDAMMKKFTKDLESICIARIPQDIDYHQSLFRAIISLQLFSDPKSDERKSGMLRPNIKDITTEYSKSLIQDFIDDMIQYTNAEIFRNLHGGAVMRMFTPKSDEDLTKELKKIGDDSFIKKWVTENGMLFPSGIRERFNLIADNPDIEDDYKTLLYRWAVSHQRFKEYTKNPKEPKELSVYWELLTKYPWKRMKMDIFKKGVNLFVVESASPPYLVCPGEGLLETYFDDSRPSAIIIRKDNVYQPMIVVAREDKEHGKRSKKPTLYTSGVITNQIEDYPPNIRNLIESLWISVGNLPSHSIRQCAAEKLSPYKDTPTVFDIIREMMNLPQKRQSPTALAVDDMGRVVGVVYAVTNGMRGSSVSAPTEDLAGKLYMIPSQPINQDLEMMIPDIPVMRIPLAGTLNYSEMTQHLSDLQKQLPKSAGNVKSQLEGPYKVVLNRYNRESEEYTIEGIRLNTGLIVPITDDRLYTRAALREEYDIQDSMMYVSSWTSETDNILTLRSKIPKPHRNKITEAIRKALLQLEKYPEIMVKIREIRMNTRLSRSMKIQRFRYILNTLDIVPDISKEECTAFYNIILNRLSILLESEALIRKAKEEEFSLAPLFPEKYMRTEIQLTYQDIDSLRSVDLYKLNSEYITGTENFIIGGATDPDYIPETIREIPLPIRNLWNEKLSYKTSTAAAILARGGILSLRMIPTGYKIIDSWNAIAITLRDAMRIPNLDGEKLLGIVSDLWQTFFEENDVLYGSVAWRKLLNKLSKEKNISEEYKDKSPEQFLKDMKEGRIEPSIADLSLIVRSPITPPTMAIAMLHGYSVGEEFGTARYPVRVIGGDPTQWTSNKYSLLMRTPDRVNTNRYTYSAIVGVRKPGIPFIHSLESSKNHIPATFLSDLSNAADKGRPPAWMNVRVDRWSRDYFKSE